ncbi:FtsX-like permease family protein [Pontibacter sp. G13]|uniref:FtsX-like permease family protein n=1 Tax=Pontibacter sp. G13 TaxID=3074898 RepID=UPI00288C46DA|nr:FtsX-like permease family protein [Pontibacter sp. G13]WNJ18985.1 FtsX-like permease family protein [Pontibacter sp. G13]
MLKHYLLTAFRIMTRNRGFALINLSGLAFGLATCMLIFLFIKHERSFDQFHERKERIYRVCEVQSWEGIIPQKVALTMFPLGPAMLDVYPEIKHFSRIFSFGEGPFKGNGEWIYLEDAVVVDSMFLDMFSFELLAGNAESALDEPQSMVLTRSTAIKLFGTEEVLGKWVQVDAKSPLSLKVTGILKDIPEQSHLQFDALISKNTDREVPWLSYWSSWNSNWVVTYLELNSPSDQAKIEAQIPSLLLQHMDSSAAADYEIFLQPLSDIHLGSSEITHDTRNDRKFQGSYLTIFGFLGFLVLLIAGINFMNLSTSRATKRAREVGVRKTIGATQPQLWQQFLGESLLYTLIAGILAIVVVDLTLPFINNLASRNLSLSMFASPMDILFIVGIVLATGLLAGLYPAFVLANFPITTILKGDKIFTRRSRFDVQDILVIGQFALATAMIVCTILIVRQLNFMMSSDPGFRTQSVMLLPRDEQVTQKYQVFQDQVSQIPGVYGITYSGQRLGNNLHQTAMEFRQDSIRGQLSVSQLLVDWDYLDLYEIEFIEGRDFDKSRSQDSAGAYIINETLARKMGLEDPLQTRIRMDWGKDWSQIIGVVEDFHYNSLHHGINPLVIHLNPGWGAMEISVMLDESKKQALIPLIEKAWHETGTKRPFQYEFLSTHFEDLYRTDQQISQVMSMGAGLCILIACLGVLGLISMATEQRAREIGIRKVLGASESAMIWLFCKRISIRVLIGFLIAIPLTWWFMQDWLSQYAFRIEIGWDAFLLAGVMTLLIAWSTIIFKAYQAAHRSPAESVRHS